eukprot:jgi/Tetstr1/443820/TSEL_003274.t1
MRACTPDDLRHCRGGERDIADRSCSPPSSAAESVAGQSHQTPKVTAADWADSINERYPPTRSSENRRYGKLDRVLLFVWGPTGLALQMYALVVKGRVIGELRGPISDAVAEAQAARSEQPLCGGGIDAENVALILYLAASCGQWALSVLAFLASLEAFAFRNIEATGGHGPLSILAFRLLAGVLVLLQRVQSLRILASIVDFLQVTLWNVLATHWDISCQCWSLIVVFNLIMYDQIITKLVYYGIWCSSSLPDVMVLLFAESAATQQCPHAHGASTGGVIFDMQRAILSTIVIGALPLMAFFVTRMKGAKLMCIGAAFTVPCVAFFEYFSLFVSSFAYHAVHSHFAMRGNFCAEPLILVAFFCGVGFTSIALGYLIIAAAIWNPIGRFVQFLTVRAVGDKAHTAEGSEPARPSGRMQHINWRNFGHCMCLAEILPWLNVAPIPDTTRPVVIMKYDNLVFRPDVLFTYLQDPDKPPAIAQGYKKIMYTLLFGTGWACFLCTLAGTLWFVLLRGMDRVGILPTSAGARWPWQVVFATVMAAMALVAALILLGFLVYHLRRVTESADAGDGQLSSSKPGNKIHRMHIYNTMAL